MMIEQQEYSGAIFGTVALLLVGCGELADDGPALAGRTFLSEVVLEGGTPRELEQGTSLSLHFDDETADVEAYAGCNYLNTKYSVEFDRLVFDSMVTTIMACPPEEHEQDDWYADFLTDDPYFALEGSQLVLDDGSTRIDYREERRSRQAVRLRRR